MSTTAAVGGATLAGRVAGQAVMDEVLRLHALAGPRSGAARALGRSPLPPEARSWFVGALGEQEVGRLLGRLGPPWRVLHAVPVGDRGSDIDHVLVGPGGVVTLTTEHHAGRRVWVAGTTLMVDGQRQPHLRNAAHEAQRAARLLSAAVGHRVPVRSAVVLVGARSLTVTEAPQDVTVLEAGRLLRWLHRLPTVLEPSDAEQVAAAAARPTTWQRRPGAPGEDPSAAFHRLSEAVATARRIRCAWALSGACATLAGAGAAVLQLM